MQTAANRIGFSQLASLLHDYLKNLVISMKLDHLQILQLSSDIGLAVGTLLATVEPSDKCL